MSVLNELNTTIRVVGPITEPRLAFDTDGLTKEFKEALAKAGKERLINEIDNRLGDQLGDKLDNVVPDQLKDAVPNSGRSIVEGLGGLLGGRNRQNDSNDSQQ